MEKSIRIRISVTAVAACLMVAACAAAIDSPPASSVATTGSPASAAPKPATEAPPSPAYAWALDGDGKPSAGDVVVELGGFYDFSDGAVALDGWTGSAATRGPGPIDLTSSFTVTAWVSYEGTDRYGAAVSQLGDVAGLFHLGVGDYKWWFMMKKQDSHEPGSTVSAQGGIAAGSSGKWVQLVGVHDQEAGVLRLYVNGEQVADAAFTSPIKAGGPLTFGRSQANGTPGNFFKGAIGDVAVYQGVLSAEQVAEMYASTAPTEPPPTAPEPDPASYADGVLNGTWDYVATAADRAGYLADAEAESGYDADELRIRFGFDDHEWWVGFVFDGQLWLVDGVPEGDDGTMRIDGDLLTAFNGTYEVTYRWTLDADKLTLEVVRDCMTEALDRQCATDKSEILALDPGVVPVTEHTFTKSGEDPSY